MENKKNIIAIIENIRAAKELSVEEKKRNLMLLPARLG